MDIKSKNELTIDFLISLTKRFNKYNVSIQKDDLVLLRDIIRMYLKIEWNKAKLVK